MSDEIFSDTEIEQLARQLCATDEAISDEDIATVLKWAGNTRLQSALLSLVLKGQVCVTVKDNVLGFALDPSVIGQATVADIEIFLKRS